MKRFKYSLDTVLDYKTQVLDELRSEHAVIARNVMTKQEQIVRLKKAGREQEERGDFRQGGHFQV